MQNYNKKLASFSMLLVGAIIAIPIMTATHAALVLQLAHSFPTVDGSGQMLGTLAVGNVDDDAALEIVVNSTTGVYVYDYDGTLVSSFSTHNGTRYRRVNMPPTLFDIDGDGRDEIIFATGHEASGDYVNFNSIFAVNGEDGSLVWEMPITRDTYTTPDSGRHTIAGQFYYDDAERDQLPAQTTFTANASAIPVFDIDGDGRPEAIVNLKIRPAPTQDYNPYINDIWGFGEYGTVGESWSGGNFILDASTGSRDYIYHMLQLSEAGLALGAVDAAQGTAVFVLSDSDAVIGYHKTAPHGFYGAGNLIGQFGKNSRIQSGSYKKPVTLNAIDLTGDGKVEVLYAGRNLADLLWQGSRVIFDHHGRILWREWYTFPETTGLANHWPNAAQMTPLNLDGGNPEIVSWHHTNQLFYEEWDGVELVSKGGNWPVSFGATFPSPPAVGDVDGDGTQEFVVARYDPTNLDASGGLTILTQDGSIAESITTTPGIKNIPNLYDVDQDGDLDIVVRDTHGTILIYDTQTGAPDRVTWATEYRVAARTGALGVRLYAANAPLVGEITAGYRRVNLEWSMEMGTETGLTGFQIQRKKYAESNFSLLAALDASARQFQDTHLENGALYIYKIEALYGTASYLSAPIPAVPLVENNLTHNSAMELNGDRGWDKWYTGDIPWSAMLKTTAQAYQGAAAMHIHLDNRDSNSSIKQGNQYGVTDAQLQVTAGELYSFGAFIKTDLDQPSRHFIEWGSNYDKYRHDPGGNPIPGREYPFYFSTHVNNPPGESDWQYTNRVLTLQQGITGLAPRHRFYIDASQAATGDIYLDNVFFRKVSPTALTLLPFESVWRYLEGNPPAGWHTAGFDDSAWRAGQAKFGAGSGPDDVNTPLTRYQDQYYFRATFNLTADLNELLAYGLSTTGPDGGAGIKDIYVNGQRIPIQDPGLSDNPGNDARILDLTPFIDVLVQGENSIAIKLTNEYKTAWDDVAFDFQLKGQVAPSIALPSLQAAKRAQPTLPKTGDIITYTIRLDNPGALLTHVRVTDTLPSALVYRGALSASSGSYAESGGIITWSGAISTGGTTHITFSAATTAASTAALPIANTAYVDDGQGNVTPYSVTIIVNGHTIYLPLVLRF